MLFKTCQKITTRLDGKFYCKGKLAFKKIIANANITDSQKLVKFDDGRRDLFHIANIKYKGWSSVVNIHCLN